jgi:hypothetical protein
VQGDEPSTWVVATAAIGSRWCARVPPEDTGAMALELAIRRPRGGVLRAVWWRKERGRRGIYRRRVLGRGVRASGNVGAIRRLRGAP